MRKYVRYTRILSNILYDIHIMIARECACTRSIVSPLILIRHKWSRFNSVIYNKPRDILVIRNDIIQ